MHIRKGVLIQVAGASLLMLGLMASSLQAMTHKVGATPRLLESNPVATCAAGTGGTAVTCDIVTPTLPVIGGGPIGVIPKQITYNNGAPITINDDQTVPFTFATILKDQRGTGAGWTLTAQAAPLVLSNGSTVPFVLNTQNPVVISCANSCSNPATLNTANGNTDLTTPVTLVSATVAFSGMGNYNILAQGSFPLPSSAPSGQTTGGGTVTLTLATP